MMLEKKPVSLTVNGKKLGPFDVPVGMPMVDFLHHFLNLTGTRLGCGQGVCHACAVIEVKDGVKTQTRTCIYGAHMFDGREIITIEGHAQLDENGEVKALSPVQQAFVEQFAFQCSYCTPGFVAGATVLIENLKRKPVKRENLELVIEQGLNDHICRCTGYVRYYEAVRDVALNTPGCVTD